MTAIAILNLESDPHILADTLLSVDGVDPREGATVWLPALGSIPTQQGTLEEPWHIARLGRKTFFLPSNSGVLAYAGDCQAAFEFWRDLSNAINSKAGYGAAVHVDRDFLIRVLGYTNRAHEFTLLGILIGMDGSREAFIHKARGDFVAKVETQLFGTCYVAGSGQEIVRKLIHDADIQISYSGGWKENRLTTATENLAEQVSSAVLFYESDRSLGSAPDSSIAARCGGFFEWYKVARNGIPTYRPRIDIHVSAQQDELVVTRIYLSEQMQSVEPIAQDAASQRYYLSIMNLGLVPEAITLSPELIEGCTLHPDECYGVCVESSFNLYDMPIGAPGELSGPASYDCLENLFHEGLEVRRVRLMVMSNDRTVARAMFAAPDEEFLMQVRALNGRVEVRLSARVMMTMLDVADRLAHT